MDDDTLKKVTNVIKVTVAIATAVKVIYDIYTDIVVKK